MSTTDTVAVTVGRLRSPDRRRKGGLGRRIVTVTALVWLALVLAACVFAPWLAPADPLHQNLAEVLAGPSAEHLLGTDSVGRDVLSRLMYGGGTTLTGVVIALVVFLVIGVIGGLVAGYAGGFSDRSIVGVNTILQALPTLIVLFVVLSIFRNSTYIAMAVYGVMASPTMFFLVRSATLSVRNELFVDAAKVSGLSPFYIIVQHVLPRVRGLIIVQAAVFAATALVVESTLSFLGFGAQPPSPSWGNMVSEAAGRISLNPFMLYAAGGAIALTAFSLGLLGDSLRDRLASSWATSKLTKDPKRGTRNRVELSEGTLLSVRGLSVGYQADDQVVPIVKHVSFDVGRGQVLGLVGESGSGKTTVAFGVLGVIGAGVAITGGQVVFDGDDLVGLSGKDLERFRGKRVAYVAQEPMVALDPNFRVAHQLSEVIRANDGLRGAAVHRRVIELLEQVELPDPEAVATKYPHELSGGMAQRVSIAAALAGRPELLVADEPTTALDVTVQAGILGLLLRLREQTGLSMLIITHDWGVVADVCDRVAVMYRGEIVEQADVDTIFREPRHEYTRALMASNPHGAEPGTVLPVITGEFLTPSMQRDLEAEPEGARA
jgi:peptide/nickel transport system permease protein